MKRYILVLALLLASLLYPQTKENINNLVEYGDKMFKHDNDLIINDPLISRIHCTIFQDSGSFYIADLKSTNGTIVDGKKIIESVALINKDQIVLGVTHLQIDIPNKN